MNITTISLIFHIILVPEIFLGISIIYLVLHSLFLGYNRNNKFALFEKSTLFLISLIMIMVCFLLINQNFLDLHISGFSNCFISDVLSNISKIIIGITSFFFFYLQNIILVLKKSILLSIILFFYLAFLVLF